MLSHLEIQKLLLAELQVDQVADDVTTRLLGDYRGRACEASVIAKDEGVFCGKAIALSLQSLFQDSVKDLECREDSSLLKRGDQVLSFVSTVEKCLTLERTLLNLLTHLSGIATQTHHFVEAVKPHATKILATRKTLPGLRSLQLMAVQAGGGFVHRRSLSDGILIKDNHVSIGGIESLLKEAKEIRSPLHKIEIEVQDLDQLRMALSYGADIIMLDNLRGEKLQEGITLIRRQSPGTKIEVSGGVQLENVREIAALGVDYISVGALTHSVKAVNMSLDMRLVEG